MPHIRPHRQPSNGIVTDDDAELTELGAASSRRPLAWNPDVCDDSRAPHAYRREAKNAASHRFAVAHRYLTHDFACDILMVLASPMSL